MLEFVILPEDGDDETSNPKAHRLWGDFNYRKKPPLVPRTCARCGSLFTQRKSEGPKRFSQRRYCQRFCYHPNDTKSWTPARVEWLKQLRSEGLSKSLIAQRMGVTRNAVVGKLDRLKAPSIVPIVSKRKTGRNQYTSGNYTPVRPRRLPGRYPPLAEFNAAIPKRQRVSIVGLTGSNCHWPVGDPGTQDFFFCGAPAEFAPYCPAHDHYAHNNEVAACPSKSTTTAKQQPTFLLVPGKRTHASSRVASARRRSRRPNKS